MILGGAAFSPDALRQQWGEELVDEFERERPALETEVYAANPGLRETAATLVSPGAFAGELENRFGGDMPAASTRNGDAESRPERVARFVLNETELQEAYMSALLQHETQLFDAVLAKFSDSRFAQVALSGRVPTQVDASFGAIEAGDPLTASPIAGVAMKAQGSGWIVGTALEAMPSGSGTIVVFADRDWFGGGE